MASLTVLLLHLLLMLSSASAWYYSYYGGSLTFTPKGQYSDGTYKVELHNKQTTIYCNLNYYSCSSGDCGTQTETTSTGFYSNSMGFYWCQYDTVNKINLNSNLPFEIRYPTNVSPYIGLGVWASNFQNSMANWIMTAHVDLGTRSDTGESNRSPITDMLPVLRVTRNCPRSFNMAVFDPDGDKVRCRVPTNSNTNECGLCGLTAGFSLDQNSCSLKYINSNQYGNHPIELVVEDFPNKPITLSYSDGSYTTKHPLSPYRTTIAPLSKLPLQFTVYVDYHNAPSCLDGDYFPVFSSPTPRNGVNLPAYVNRTLEIKVKSEAQYTTIYDLIVTGPKGISKRKISTEEFIINWTPTENELNDHFPICFVSEARDTYYQVFQSEPRCVIVDVGSDETTVTCNETTITVEVEKSYLIRHNEGKLHLNDFSDASCNLTTRSNTTHLVAVMSLNTCGTTVEEDENNIIFKNMITSGDPTEIISRQNDVEIVFSCAYPKRSNLTLGFTHKNPYVFTEKGFGAFTFQFEFFQSQRFRKQIESSTYPVEVYLKQMIFMQIEATTSIPNTELFVESCKATPYDNPNSRISYTIIENGCVRDNTVEIYNSSKSQFRFGMEAFEFIGAHEQVYITCSVILCETGVLGSRCSQGCINSNSGNLRVKREAVAQSSRHTISQGPLHLAKTSDSQASGPSLNMGLNIIFIVGCLLACGVVIYRSRRSKAKYQPLPTFETD
ncbi:hypothetical protein EPR50_G00008880 [Perca flavescens]|uniref:ZP domain-containing protein n=1 Tax=Perca flavescens TaxID=8167 RepID=A0A484DR50_PERFV|nr:hypothetical protein EPR50_G00008880 [Perca flavescens]